MSRPDDLLLRRARDGDTAAFGELVERHQSRIYAVCLRILADPEEARDAAQDAFITAFRKLAQFRGDAAFTTWLHRIAVNTVLERRRGPANAEVAVEDPTEYEEATSVLDSPVEEEELEAAIESLPQGARDALVLCGVYGYEHSEAASMLGIAVGTCKAQLHRARGLLKDRLERGVR